MPVKLNLRTLSKYTSNRILLQEQLCAYFSTFAAHAKYNSHSRSPQCRKVHTF